MTRWAATRGVWRCGRSRGRPAHVEELTIKSFMHLPLSAIDRVESYRISFVEVSARSVAEYVCHVGDNLRIWAERLMGVVEGAPPQ